MMHTAWGIACEGLDAETVKPYAGTDLYLVHPKLNIQWVHRGMDGQYDETASRLAARAMVQEYHIVYPPAYPSKHSQGLAIDMTIDWKKSDLVLRFGAFVTKDPADPTNRKKWKFVALKYDDFGGAIDDDAGLAGLCSEEDLPPPQPAGTSLETWEAPVAVDDAGYRNGAKNGSLHDIGREYFSIQKLTSDPPHWSSDGTK